MLMYTNNNKSFTKPTNSIPCVSIKMIIIVFLTYTFCVTTGFYPFFANSVIKKLKLFAIRLDICGNSD